MNATRRELDAACLTAERLRLDLDPATTFLDFLPLGFQPIPRETRKPLQVAFHVHSSPSGAGRSSPVFETAIEVAMVAA